MIVAEHPGAFPSSHTLIEIGEKSEFQRDKGNLVKSGF
jgi:hypothetical protein